VAADKQDAGRQSGRHHRREDRRPLDVKESSEDASATPSTTDEDVDFLVIGRVVAPRGVHGELKIEILTEDPQRFHGLETVYLGEQNVAFSVRHVSLHLAKNQAFLQLEGIRDPDSADAWRDAYVYVSIKDALPLEEGQYYYHQIEGLLVVTTDGEPLGRIQEILPTGANDVYVIDGPQGELLLPAIRDVVYKIDLDEGVVVVRVPEGL
jgi:16S rRNA processing protein RimM